MFTDMVGYTALGQRNEALSLAVVEEQRKLVRPILSKHNGREIKTIGDAFLVEFTSALDAVRCAYDIQRQVREANVPLPAESKMHLRIGIHLGDVIEHEDDISGDAVNVASRIEPLAPDGGVCVTRTVYESVRNKIDVPLMNMGAKDLKNVSEPVEVYRMQMPWEAESKEKAGEMDTKRVAVLPFVSLSPDPNDEYFADGLTEEIIATMSRIGGLRVIARTSVMGYKSTQKKISDIAKELEVGTVLEGSVRKAGERARINVQLVNGTSSEHLWAESYDRELKDVFRIQSEISETVAEALKVRLTSQEKERVEKEQTKSSAAHTLYLKGRYHFNERTEENVRKALEHFERAAAADSVYALAYSGMADCYTILADYGWMAPEKANPLAREYCMKALRLDDTLAEAHASYGVTLNVAWDFVSSEREFKRAIELRPSYAPAYHWDALRLLATGRPEEAFQKEKLALEVDPYSRVINLGLANALYYLERYDESLERYNQLVEANPDFAAGHFWKSGLHVMRGERGAAVREARRAFQLDSSMTMELNLAFVLAATGNREEAAKVLENVRQRSSKERVNSAPMGLAELALGEGDEGFRWLNEALNEKDMSLFFLRIDPWFRQFLPDPRWKEIDQKLHARQQALHSTDR